MMTSTSSRNHTQFKHKYGMSNFTLNNIIISEFVKTQEKKYREKIKLKVKKKQTNHQGNE